MTYQREELRGEQNRKYLFLAYINPQIFESGGVKNESKTIS